jgi:hypothetical protein
MCGYDGDASVVVVIEERRRRRRRRSIFICLTVRPQRYF